MEENLTVNRAQLRGALCGAPALSHTSRGESYYVLPVETLRLSGAADRINVLARRQLLEACELNEGGSVRVTGELRSFNNRRGDGARLVITLFARTLDIEDGDSENSVELYGALCKPPNLRVTPMGREICDLMLAVNRRCGRSDYLPCICWGQLAREAAALDTGDKLRLRGRIQSRSYIKVTEEGAVTKIAFEVSASEIEPL